MTVYLEIAPQFEKSPHLPDFDHCVTATFENQETPIEADLTIVVDGDERIRELNNNFLGQDKPTDVLAFPAGHIDPDTGHTYLGDIVISYTQAKTQAEAAGHLISSELCLLVVHGLLHLLGHDHDTQESKAVMWSAQDLVLAHLDVNMISPGTL